MQRAWSRNKVRNKYQLRDFPEPKRLRLHLGRLKRLKLLEGYRQAPDLDVRHQSEGRSISSEDSTPAPPSIRNVPYPAGHKGTIRSTEKQTEMMRSNRKPILS